MHFEAGSVVESVELDKCGEIYVNCRSYERRDYEIESGQLKE